LASIIRVVDWMLDTDYLSKREMSTSEGVMQRSVWIALTSHFCPLLVLDEFQTLGDLSESQARTILRGLIRLMEMAGIPVLIVGTEKVRRLLERYPAEMSKFSNEGPTEFPLLEEGSDDARVLTRTFMSRHVSLTKPRRSDDFDRLFMLHTMGVTRVMREYFKVIHRRHALDESLVIDGELLKDIAKHEMKIFEPAMSVLRRRALGIPLSFREWQQYEDLLPPDRITPSPQAKRINAEWLAVFGAEGHMPADVYDMILAKTRSEQGADEATATPLTSGAQALAKRLNALETGPPANPKPPAPTDAKPGDAGRAARAMKARAAKAKAAREQAKALARLKAKSLDSVRRKKAPSEGPSSIDPSDIR
jgi:hypothetical protein